MIYIFYLKQNLYYAAFNLTVFNLSSKTTGHALLLVPNQYIMVYIRLPDVQLLQLLFSMIYYGYFDWLIGKWFLNGISIQKGYIAATENLKSKQKTVF